MKYRLEDMVQRGHIYAIVDEVDSILVDEARTPLIISGPLDDRSDLYNTIDAFIPELDKTDFEVDEKQRTVTLTEAGNEKHRAAAARRGPAQGRHALRHRERLDRAPRQPGAEGPQAVPARQGLHRAQRRGRHHRRVHRPHDAGPPLLGRPAPGARGQGAPADPAREPDARLDHVPELLPHVREARRHDRHGGDRGRRVHRHLRSRGARGPDQHAARAPRRRRRGLPHGGGEVPRRAGRDRACQPALPAGAGRHRLDREVRAARRHPAQERLQADRLQQPGRAGEALRGRALRQAEQAVRRAQRALPRAGSLHRRRGRRAGRDHDRDQHGGPRHRHQARRQRRDARRDRRPRTSPTRPRRRRRSPRSAPRSSASGRSCSRPRRRSRSSPPRAASRPRPSTRPAGSTSSAPSATSRGASTTSCAAAPAARAIPAARSSSCRSRTT